MDSKLQRILQSVASRYRALLLASALTVLYLVLALIGWNSATSLIPSSANTATRYMVLIVIAFAPAMLVWLLSLRFFRDIHQIARRIEIHYPQLKQRLITATQAIPNVPGVRRNVLQDQLLEETLGHAACHSWLDLIPNWKLLTARILALSMMLFAIWSWNTPAKRQTAEAIAKNSPPSKQTSIQIEPGDIEVERGSNLVVTARFPTEVPANVSLQTKLLSTGESSKQAMRRNLSDPVFGGYLIQIREDLNYAIQYDDQSSQEYKVRVFDFPSLVRSDANIDPPAYTGMPSKLIENTRRVTIPEGTKVTWSFHTNKPIATAALIGESDEETPIPVAANAQLLTMEMTPLASAKWKLKLVDADGRICKFQEEISVRVQPNKAPSIKLAKATDARVSPVEELPVAANVSDDFGVTKVGVTYQFADQPPVDVVISESAEKRAQPQHVIAFEALKAQPDQLLSYYVWAEDTDSQGEVRRTTSDLFFAEVRPFEEIFREGEESPQDQSQQSQQQSQAGQQQNQQAEQLAELQKQVITATWNVARRENPKKPSSKFQEDTELLIQSQKDALEQLEAMATEETAAENLSAIEAVRTQMSRAVEGLENSLTKNDPSLLRQALTAEQTAYQELLKMRPKETDFVRSQQPQSSSSSSSASQRNRQQQLNELELKNDPNRYESEQTPTAEQPEEQAAQEMRQIMSRLSELARRQEDLNDQLQQLQNALEAAESEQEREEIREQLKRLRDSQEEMLRDSDELLERMNQASEQEAVDQMTERMEQTREQIQESAEALANESPSQALSSGARAQRELDEMQNELREQSANEFQQSMKDIVEQSRELEEQQKQLEQQIATPDPSAASPQLRPDNQEQPVQEQVEKQRAMTKELMEKIQETVTQAEEAEPLLADKLYDSYRKAEQRQINQKLEAVSEVFRQGVQEQLQNETNQTMREVSEGVTELRQGIEESAQSVLGNSTESLKRALSELDKINQQLDEEIAAKNPGQQQPGQQQPGQQQPGQQQPGQQQPGQQQPGQQQPGQQQPGQQQPGQQQPGQQQPGQQQPGQQQPGQQQPGQQQPGQQQPGQQQPGQQQPGQQQPGQQQPGQQQPGQQQPGQQQPGQQQPGQQQPGQQQPGQQQPGQQQPGQQQPGQQQPGQQQPGQQQPGSRRGARTGGGERTGSERTGEERGGGGVDRLMNSLEEQFDLAAPLTGDDFGEWSDALRDVEQIIDDPEMRAEAARAREAAREIRREFTRHAEEPQWDLVEKMVAVPLRELRKKVQDELLRRSAEKNSVVPIDSDPVPSTFEKQLQEYYEKLGSGR